MAIEDRVSPAESDAPAIEIHEVSDAGSRLEIAAESVSRKLANTISRRSFLGRLGIGAIAATLGNGASVLIFPEEAACPYEPMPKRLFDFMRHAHWLQRMSGRHLQRRLLVRPRKHVDLSEHSAPLL